MKKKIENMVAAFLIRMVIGMAVIFFVNQLLVSRNIDVSVGINGISAAASGILGLPGIGLLYGIAFYRFL